MKLSLNHDTTNLVFDLKEKTGQGINHIVCEAIKKYHAEQLSNKMIEEDYAEYIET